MRLNIRTLTIIAISLAALVATSPADADSFAKPASAAARGHLARGNKLYGIRSFDEAVAEYKAGALVESVPVFDYNLGQCYRQLGRYQEALWYYQRFLAHGDPQGELLAAVNNFIAQIKSELNKKAMTQPPLEPAATQGSVPALVHRHDQPPIPSNTEAWYADTFGWGLAATGVAGLAVGGGLLLDAANLNDDAKANPFQQESERLYDKASTRNLLGTVISIGGAGLFVTGIIKLAVHSNESARVAGWNISTSGTGVMVFGSF